MVQKTDTQSAPTPASQQVLDEHLQVTTDKVRTRGWVMFDTLVHGGINGVLNIGASLLMSKDRANDKINKLVDARLKEGAPQVKDSGVFTSKLDVKKSDRRTTYLTNLPSLNPQNWFDKEKRDNNRWSFYDFSDKINNGSINFFGKVSKAANLKDDSFLGNLSTALGKYTGAVLFLSWGGHVTNSLMWMMESPRIKPKFVRALDKMIDGVNNVFGKKLTPEELEIREQIYAKLDSDLAGKSLKGVWGARFAGIANIIAVASLAEAVDVSITGTHDKDGNKKSQTGILRASQGFFKGAGFMQQKIRAKGDQANWKFLSNDETSVEAARARDFADQTVTEVLGTGITTATQYTYLMARELLGVGPKTNVGDKKNAKGKNNQSLPKAKPPVEKVERHNGPLATTEKTTKVSSKEFTNEVTPKKKDYTTHTKPTGNDYKTKARYSQQQHTLQEHSV